MIKKCVSAAVALCVCVTMTGCYDMVDIEDILSVAAVCVDEGGISYCTVSASANDKKYSHEVYRVEGNNLYHGMNSISRQTGRKVSMSHLEAIMFSTGCGHGTARDNINALLGSTNSHPKAMAVYYAGDTEEFLENISVSSDTGFGKKIRSVLENPYARSPQCSAMELCYAMNFEGGGVSVPVISLDADGNIVYDGAVFADSSNITMLDKTQSVILTAMQNVNSEVYTDAAGQAGIKCTSFDISYNRGQNAADIDVCFEYNDAYGREDTRSEISKILTDAVNNLVIQHRQGFDILNVYEEMKKAFGTKRSLEKFVSDSGGVPGAVANVELNVRTQVSRKGESN